jgi:hypothetical protein
MKPFLIDEIPNFWDWQINLRAFRVFLVDLLAVSTNFGTVGPLSMFSIIQPLFLKNWDWDLNLNLGRKDFEI